MIDPLTDHEVAGLRAATPGCNEVVHLNHAGSSLPSQATLRTQIDHLETEARIGGYEAAAAAHGREEAVYQSLANLIGGRSSEIARAEHATAAWNAGFWSIPMAAGQRIVTARAAYGANAVAFLRAEQRFGVRIEVVPDDESGQVDVDALTSRLDDDVALVALTHIPTNGGLVNPAAAVGAATRAAGVPFLLDACQSVGQLDLDVETLGCDLLSGTGRKYLRGPRGTGFLWASHQLLERLETDHPDHHGADWLSPDSYRLRDDARRFEWWEYAHAGWLALGTAADEAIAVGTDRIERTVIDRGATLRQRLESAGFATKDKGRIRCGIVTVETQPLDPTDAKEALRSQGINTSVTTPASTRFDSSTREIGDLLRVSVHYLTTDEEIDRAIQALTDLRG